MNTGIIILNKEEKGETNGVSVRLEAGTLHMRNEHVYDNTGVELQLVRS